MNIADALSRAYMNSDPDPNEKFEYEVVTVESTTSAFSPPRYDELVNATAADDDSSKLTSIINQGSWPSKYNAAPSWLQPYHSFRDELAVEDGVVFRGAKLLYQQHYAQTTFNNCIKCISPTTPP